MVIVSACLLGERCRYDGESQESAAVIERMAGKSIFAVCPEVAGGLPTPRAPAERVGGRVQTAAGVDVSEAYARGAEEALRAARERAAELGEPIELAILKARSPSCGRGQIYDGSFRGRLTEGDGEFAKLLKEQGIPVITEEDLT